jgi:hypothetical protein
MSILKQALKQIVANSENDSDDDPKVKDDSALEQAMSDFQSATTPKERAAAFKAALELAK